MGSPPDPISASKQKYTYLLFDGYPLFGILVLAPLLHGFIHVLSLVFRRVLGAENVIELSSESTSTAVTSIDVCRLRDLHGQGAETAD